ncbi:hypothetical protein [Chrysiogenes arsenatis]|uniref:hypothetical protein n=1 Tax=Chrysiogenes arsenatis TaxID=309797 RepID=UPI00040FCE79|nr:hypothetical protein [Chrysiogenes arsenatis]
MLRRNMQFRKSLVSSSCAASLASLHGKDRLTLPDKQKLTKTRLAPSGSYDAAHPGQR